MNREIHKLKIIKTYYEPSVKFRYEKVYDSPEVCKKKANTFLKRPRANDVNKVSTISNNNDNDNNNNDNHNNTNNNNNNNNNNDVLGALYNSLNALTTIYS